MSKALASQQETVYKARKSSIIDALYQPLADMFCNNYRLGWATIRSAIRGMHMRLYESVFIARQDISTGQVNALCDEFEKIVTDGGGEILKKEYWGLKSLAYRIKKNRKGHYIMFNMKADADTMNEYDRRLGLNEDVLRVLTIKIDEVDAEPSIMMQSKSERSHDSSEAKAEG